VLSTVIDVVQREITPHVAHVPVQDNAEGDPAARQPHSIKGSVSKKDKMLALFVGSTVSMPILSLSLTASTGSICEL
jgi:hypothetical protein